MSLTVTQDLVKLNDPKVHYSYHPGSPAASWVGLGIAPQTDAAGAAAQNNMMVDYQSIVISFRGDWSYDANYKRSPGNVLHPYCEIFDQVDFNSGPERSEHGLAGRDALGSLCDVELVEFSGGGGAVQTARVAIAKVTPWWQVMEGSCMQVI